MAVAVEDGVLFSAELRPRRGVGLKAIHTLIWIVGGVSFVVGFGFWMAGAWPVFGFLGLDVGLLYLALRLHHRTGNRLEAIDLTPDALTVRLVDPWGRRRMWSFQPYWLQVNLMEAEGRGDRLELRSHGKSLVIGEFLMPEERRALARALRAALRPLSVAT